MMVESGVLRSCETDASNGGAQALDLGLVLELGPFRTRRSAAPPTCERQPARRAAADQGRQQEQEHRGHALARRDVERVAGRE
jgi:hypothetical protein